MRKYIYRRDLSNVYPITEKIMDRTFVCEKKNKIKLFQRLNFKRCLHGRKNKDIERKKTVLFAHLFPSCSRCLSPSRGKFNRISLIRASRIYVSPPPPFAG